MLISYVPFDGTSKYIENVVSLSLEMCDEEQSNEWVRAKILNDAKEEDHKGWVALCNGEVVGYAYGYRCMNTEVEKATIEVIGESAMKSSVYDCFERVEMGVSPKYKHAGIESTLEKRLLDETLTTANEEFEGSVKPL